MIPPEEVEDLSKPETVTLVTSSNGYENLHVQNFSVQNKNPLEVNFSVEIDRVLAEDLESAEARVHLIYPEGKAILETKNIEETSTNKFSITAVYR